MLTDGPAEDFCQILATVERIDLLGTNGPTNVFMGPETVNVLDMRNYSDVFSIATSFTVQERMALASPSGGLRMESTPTGMR